MNPWLMSHAGDTTGKSMSLDFVITQHTTDYHNQHMKELPRDLPTIFEDFSESFTEKVELPELKELPSTAHLKPASDKKHPEPSKRWRHPVELSALLRLLHYKLVLRQGEFKFRIQKLFKFASRKEKREKKRIKIQSESDEEEPEPLPEGPLKGTKRDHHSFSAKERKRISYRRRIAKKEKAILQAESTLKTEKDDDVKIQTHEDFPHKKPMPHKNERYNSSNSSFSDEKPDDGTVVTPTFMEFVDSLPDDIPEEHKREYSDVLNHIEKVSIFAYWLSRARDWYDILFALLGLIKHYYPDESLALGIYNQIKKALDISKSEMRSLKPQSMSTDMKDTWTLMREHKMWPKISYLISTGMALSVCAQKKIKFDMFGMEVLNIEASKKQVQAFDVVDAVVETFTWMYDTGIQVIQTRSFAPILYSDQRMAEFNTKCDFLFGNYENILNGNIEYEMTDFITEIEDCIKLVGALKAVKKDGAPSIWLQHKYEKLCEIADKANARMLNCTMREAPFCVSISGGTCVGKSILGGLSMQCTLTAITGRFKKDRVLTHDNFDQYQSTYSSDIEGVFLDDKCNSKAAFAKQAETDIIIKYFNNIAAQAVKAELGAKGRVFINFKAGVITTNVKRLDAHIYSNCPESILRRMVHAVVKVKPEYCKPGTTMLNTDHPDIRNAKETIVDVWNIDLEEVWVNETEGKTEYGFRPVWFTGTDGNKKKCVNMNFREYLTVLGTLAKEWSINQKKVLKRHDNITNVKFCNRCFNHPDYCECPKCEPILETEEYDDQSDCPSLVSRNRIYPVEEEDEDCEDEQSIEEKIVPHGENIDPPTTPTVAIQPQSDEWDWVDKYFDASAILGTFARKLLSKSIQKCVNSIFGPILLFGKAPWILKPVAHATTNELANAFKRDFTLNVLPLVANCVPSILQNTETYRAMNSAWFRISAEYDFSNMTAMCNVGASFSFMGALMTQLPWQRLPGMMRITNSLPLSRTSTTNMLFGCSALCLGGLALTESFKRKRILLYRQEYLTRKDAIPEYLRTMVSEIPKPVTYAVTAIALVAGLRALQLWNRHRISVIKQQSLASPEDVDKSPGWLGGFWSNIGLKVEVDTRVTTSTPEHIKNSIRKNLYRVTIDREGGTKTGCNVVFLQKFVGLLPKHCLYPGGNMQKELPKYMDLTIDACTERPGSVFKTRIDSSVFVSIPNLDMVMFYAPNCPDVKDITHLLPKSLPSGTYPAYMTMLDKAGQLHTDTFSVKSGNYSHDQMGFYGGGYNTPLAIDGACMGPIIARSKKPCITGFHIGGSESRGIGVMQSLTFTDYERSLRTLKERESVLISGQATEIPLEQYSEPLMTSSEINEKAIHLRRLPKTAFVDLLGSTRHRSEQRSRVSKSLLSDHVEEVFGVPNQWGPPKLKPNWAAYNENIDYFSVPSNQFTPSELERAKKDWLKPLLPLARRYGEKDLGRPLTLHESVNGIPAIRFVDAIPMSTSMGFPVFGPKSLHFEQEFEEGMSKRTPSREVLREMDRLMTNWSKGLRGYPVTTATLKDTPTKLSSNKVRVFQAGPVAFGIYLRMYFLPVMRFLQLHPLQSESAVGVNAFDKDWQELMEHVEKYSPDNKVLGLDYFKYDATMNSQITINVMDCFLRLAQEMGYAKQDLEIMQTMVSDLAHPLMDFNGTMLMAYNMNTSGNNLTVNINSTAGSLYLRLGFFHVYPNAPDFRQCVAAMTYGDDMVGSVKLEWRKFNFLSYKEFLGQHGMKITLPDKTDDEVEFLEKGKCDFLKRVSNYIPEIGCSIGKLDELSIFKSLHANVESSTTSKEEVAISCCESALHEWFGFGRDHYETRRAQLQEVCTRAGIPLTTAFRSFDLRVDDWKNKYTVNSPSQEDDPFVGKEEASTSELARAQVPGQLVEEETSLFCQSEEYETQPTSQMTAGNVQFSDAHPGYGYDNSAAADPLRSDLFSTDVQLTDFFQRPVKIFQDTWDVNVPFERLFDPWTRYFENPRVNNRISNYRLLSCKLKIKIMINGNSFYFGRMIGSYLPMDKIDQFSVKSNYTLNDMVFLTQRPHIYIDPTQSQGGELTLPFFTPYNALSVTAGGGGGFVPAASWRDMGEMSLYAFSLLQHANGATEPVTITVLAWAEDVKLSIPTQTNAIGITAQSDEYKVSGVASAVANWAGRLASAPVIGTYARATEIGAGSVAAIAKMFGYSRPTDYSVSQFRPTPKTSFATVDTHDDLYKLTVDSKQELSIDPRIAGLSGDDELAINNIATRESWIYQFSWDVTDTPETRLFNMIVDPSVHRATGGQLRLPACAFASLPFLYWRGTMKIRIQVASAAYHKGRLKIVYDPVQSATTAEDNLAYMKILDLSENSDIEIDVKWGQTTPYRECLFISSIGEAGMFNTSSNSDLISHGNGILSFYVMNELTVPNSTAPRLGVDVNVFVSAHDDIEFAAPSTRIIPMLRLDTSTTANPVVGQSEEMSTENPAMEQDSAPTSAPLSYQLGTAATHSAANMVHFGEKITSFRQMLKRYTLHEMAQPRFDTNEDTDIVLLTFIREAMPFNAGYCASAVSQTPGKIPRTLTNGEYAYAFTTLLQYITYGFAGYRGGIRYIWDFSTLNLGTDVRYYANVARLDHQTFRDGIPTNREAPYGRNTNQITASLMDSLIHNSGLSGLARTLSAVNPLLTFEVPFYTQYRFFPARVKERWIQFRHEDFSQPYSVTAVQNFDSADTAQDSPAVFVAGAEDFAPMFYIGPPIFYVEPTFPSS